MWASTFILDTAANLIFELKLEEIKLFIDVGTAVPMISDVRGKLFEHFTHRLMSKQATSRKFRRLSTDQILSSDPPLLSLPIQTAHYFRNVDEIDPFSYNIPMSPKIPGIDSLIPAQGLLFQMTLRKDHGVQATVLEGMKHGVFDKYLAADPNNKIKLVFAVDPKRYLTMKLQPYYGVTNAPLQGELHTRLPWIEQWA